ncbi:MAG: hypothetical protein ABUS49_02510 [Acidobacteriota bacterium]
MKHRHHLAYWILGVVVLLAFTLWDTAVVALPAMALSVGQLLACAAAFLLIAGGVLFTVWRLE